MELQPFTVKTKFVFEGEFKINARTKAEARELVEKHCGLVLGGDIHTSLPDEVVTDWDFGTHPDKKVISVK